MPRDDANPNPRSDSTLDMIQCEAACHMLAGPELGGFFGLLAIVCECLDVLDCAGLAEMMANPLPPRPVNANGPGFGYLAHAPAWQRQAPKFQSGMRELRLSGLPRFSPSPSPSRKPKPI